MEYLTALLASIIRPIIQEELEKLKAFFFEQMQRTEIYEKYDVEAQDLIAQIAKANTSEERWAYVAKLKARRATLGIK